jgi:hypothetical protein
MASAAGHSGQSVYEWRVYHVFTRYGRSRQTLLTKHRTKEAAEMAAAAYRAHAANVAAR